jgi:TP901 family phage tail tape measure protein
MSAKATTNRITLKVAVVYDQADALKQAKNIQSGIDKQSEQTMKNASKNSKTATDNINKTNSALKTQRSFLDKVTGGWDNVIAKTLKSVFITGTFFKALRQIRVAIEIATELDTAYTNLAIVSKATASQISQIDAQVDNLTTSLGRMKKEVIDSITEFSRAGFTISESLLLAENAIMGANVGATSLEKITTFLVAGLKSFKMEAKDSIQILDVLFRVANTTAINLEGIGEAFLRSANTLFTAGASLEQSAALIAAANESIQNPASVGTALKTIASRLRGIGDEGEVVPTLAKDFKAVGIEIQNADGSFRNIYDVFKDFADIYDTLDDLTKESLLEKLAGKRQKNIMIGLLENFDIAEMAFENALTSAGEVALAQEKYVKSLEGRFKILRETFNQFLMSLTNTQVLKELVSLFSGLIGGLTWIINNAPIIISAISGIGVAIAFAFGVANPFSVAIAGIIGAFFAAQQAMSLFGDQTDKINKKIAEATSAIEKLESEIRKLEEIDQSSRTDAENALLKTYQAQLEAKKELLRIEEGRLATQELENFKKIEQGIDGLSSAVDLFQTQLSELNGVMEDDMIDTNLELQESFYQLELRLLGNIQRAEENLKIFDENSVAYKTWNTILEKSVSGLDALKSKAGEFGYQLGSLAVNADKASQSMNRLKSSTERALGDAKQGTKDYQLLADAIVQVKKQGYLTNEMFDELLLAFPDIITMTGLASDKMIEYAEATRKSSESMIDDHIKLLKTQRDVFKEQINLYEASMQLLASGVGGNDELMYMAQFALSAQSVAMAKTAITNATNSIAALENQKKAFAGVKKARDESLKDKEKEIRVLTTLEDKIRSINQAINMQQKLLARTEDETEQIAINKSLILLYDQLKVSLTEQKKALDEKNKSLKKGMDGYEDYIDATMKLSLEIEDATNNIFKLNKANADLIEGMESKRIKAIQDEIKKLNKDFADDIKDQIATQKDLAKQRAEYYKNEIDNKKKEIDALREQNEEIDDQVRLQELLLDLQTLRERRQNILDNKNVRVVRDSETGFEWVSDPRELRKVNEDIANAEQAIDKFRRDMLVKENTRKLELEIEGLEARARAEQESYDKRIDELELFQDAVNLAIEENLPIPINLTQTLQDNLTSVEQGSYGIRLGNLSTFIASYNALMASLASPPSYDIPASQTLNGGSITPSAGSSNLTSGTGGSGSAGSMTTSAPKASAVASKITPTTTTSKPPISVNNVNVTSTARTVDAIVIDAINRVKVMTHEMR